VALSTFCTPLAGIRTSFQSRPRKSCLWIFGPTPRSASGPDGSLVGWVGSVGWVGWVGSVVLLGVFGSLVGSVGSVGVVCVGSLPVPVGSVAVGSPDVDSV